MAIFYIHGFCSSIKNNKNKIKELSEIFEEKIYGLNYDSEQLPGFIIGNLIEQAIPFGLNEEHIFIGSSLGGFFAEILAYETDNKCILINPCFQPSEFLKQFIGNNTIYGSNEKIILTEKIVKDYDNYKVNHSCPKMVILSDKDEIIDSKLSFEYYENNSQIIQIKGKHRVLSMKPFEKEFKIFKESICLWN